MAVAYLRTDTLVGDTYATLPEVTHCPGSAPYEVGTLGTYGRVICRIGSSTTWVPDRNRTHTGF